MKEETIRLNKLHEEEIRVSENVEKIDAFDGIFANITERALLIKCKCSIPVKTLPDCQILEKINDAKMLDKEFNDILDWITELKKVSPSNYKETKKYLNEAFAVRDDLKLLKAQFLENLDAEVKSRDLSAEKMKNAFVLNLNLPKFHGYGSPNNFYTFKNEFEKLISPRIQAKLLPDYLKNNYLEGQAVEIVKN